MTDLTPAQFFNPDGGIIASVKKGFAPRKGQQELSELILKVTEEANQHVLAEGPTGFGKSFAALVPAIILAVTKKQRIVISTETLNLQDQYVLNDLPALQAACAKIGIHFTFAPAKGRSNYLCKLKFQDSGGITELDRWAHKQQLPMHSGDKASVPFRISDQEWRSVGADEDCERKGCPYYGDGAKGETDCFVFSARKDFLEADIVVTNHTLFLLDAQTAPGTILGSYSMAIVDEAHTIPEQAQSTWGVEIGPNTVSSTLKLANRMFVRSGIHVFEGNFLDDFYRMEDEMFEPFKAITHKSVYLKNIRPSIIDRSKAAAQDLIEALILENKRLKDFADENENTTEIVGTARDKIFKLIRALKAIFGDEVNEDYKDNWLVYLESKTNRRNERYGVLHLKPIDVAPLIRSYILDSVPNVVFMSATLQIHNSFNFMRRELGIAQETCTEFLGETPFDYANSVVGYYPTDLPDPDDDDYLTAMAKRIRTIIRRRNGRCLILFTSADLMKKMHEAVGPTVTYTCFVQGEANKNLLLEMFKEDVGSCLFATKSFFAGVDVPGEALSTVVLTKAPFRVPSDPLFKAKCEKIKASGRDDFSQYSLPLMLLDVKQAFGRLIRSVDDVGMFCFLDSRANKKAYGQKIKNALPKMRSVPVIPIEE